MNSIKKNIILIPFLLILFLIFHPKEISAYNITPFASTGTMPYDIKIDSNGNIYTSNYSSGNISKITPAGSSSIFYNAGGGIGFHGMVFDSSGNLYTANYVTNNVYKITPSGVMSVLGTTGTNPYDITIDGSGNIYTSNYTSNNVSKITPEGVSTILGTTGTGPYGITIDGSGNIYTVNTGSNNVSKITPLGVSSILGNTGTFPIDIAIDSSGNIYSANYTTNNVSKITPVGVSSILGTTGTNPHGIVVDSLGNVYTSNRNSNNVSKITSSGISTIIGTTGSEPRNLIFDQNGNIFAVNSNASSISKITNPTITEITPIPTPSSNLNPNYIFNSNNIGIITYGGACSSSNTNAIIGSNTVALNTLNTGTYTDCTIKVNDSFGPSNIITIPSFTIIDVTIPVLSSIHIQSNNLTSNLAKTGDTITLSWTSDDNPTSQTVTIGNQSVTPSCSGTGPVTCNATLIIDNNIPVTDGILPFSITTTSLGGTNGPVTATGDGSLIYQSNSDLVIAGPYDTAVSGAANWGYQGTGYREFISIGQKYRIRQQGTISSIKIYTVDKTNLTGFYLKIWRKNGSNYDLVGTSNNIINNLVQGNYSTINLTTPISGVQEGDYYGYRVESNGLTYAFYAKTGVAGVTTYYVNNVTPSSVDYAWTSGSSAAGVIMPVEFYMTAPQVVFIGDSIIAGHPSHYSFLESTATTNINSTIGKQLSNLTGFTYQNMGIGSQTTSDISTRFSADVINLKPKIIVIEGGVNDITGSVAKSTYITNLTNMLNLAQSDNGVLKVMVLKILPWTNGTNTQLRTRDDWNNSLTSLVSGYSKAVIVDTSTYVGQFRTGGDTGNLWDIKSAYNADGVHFNQTGYLKIAQAINESIPSYQYSGDGSNVTINRSLPTITTFTIPSNSSSLTVPITTFTATDDIEVTGYLLTETSNTPNAGSGSWTASAPTEYIFTTAGSKTLYAWAKDASLNVSTSLNGNVLITLPDVTSPKKGSSGSYPFLIKPKYVSNINIINDKLEICEPYLLGYIKKGNNNNQNEVKKLQTFLNTYEGENLIIDGLYKEIDIVAIKRFQLKYKDPILTFWNLKEPTGYVYSSTIKTINRIYCQKTKLITCPYFNNYPEFNSSSSEVLKIRKFLIETQNEKISSVSSIYDYELKSAVKRFQGKYKDKILKPWGLKNPTGNWYQSTRKYAEELIGCYYPIRLSNGVVIE